jgi:methylenetetrahydrofolate dehydrogenase (NADP+) / methenyltetrahydrofolate cyclohydrolase / formyltetrahydrofolate synthetase
MMHRINAKRAKFLFKYWNKSRKFSTVTCPETGFTVDTDSETKAVVIDGVQIASKIKSILKKEISTLQQYYQPQFSTKPKLGYILVGNRLDSELYVKMKKKAWSQIGIDTVGRQFSSSATQSELSEYIMELNEDQTVSGILVQLPLPDEVSTTAIWDTIRHSKDVDGTHRLNMAAMARHEDPTFTPCTPKGIMWLIKSVWPNILGKKATVIGRSNIVGMPIALLLQKEFATVTLWHAHTQNLKEEIASADIVVSATGCPYLVKGDFIKPGAIVIDVGTQFINDKSRKSGRRLVGDVDYKSVSKRAGFVTPVPGGVGPMTIAMLMDNIVWAWKKANFSHIKELIEKMDKDKYEAFTTSFSNYELE